MSRHRTVSEEPFLRGVAEGLCPCGAFSDQPHVGYVEAEHRGVGGDFVASRAAKQGVDGHVEGSALQIPEGAVDDGYCHHGLPVPSVNLRAVHDVPQKLGGHRIAVEEERRELLIDQIGHGLFDGTADADRAVVGLDLDEVGVVIHPVGLALLGDDVGAPLRDPKFLVDIERHDEAVFPELALGFDRAEDVSNPYVGDLRH